MKVMQITQKGANPNIKVENIAAPIPADGEVLLKIEYAGINPVDCTR